MSYEKELAILTTDLFSLKQRVTAFEAKHNVVFVGLDLIPEAVETIEIDDGIYDKEGYHKQFRITRPDANGFVRMEALDRELANLEKQYAGDREKLQQIANFPRYVCSIAALEALGFDSVNEKQLETVKANAAWVQFFGGYLGYLAKDRNQAFFARDAYQAADGYWQLMHWLPNSLAFASTQVDRNGKVTWQGPTLEEQGNRAAKIANTVIEGEGKIGILIMGYSPYDPNLPGNNF